MPNSPFPFKKETRTVPSYLTNPIQDHLTTNLTLADTAYSEYVNDVSKWKQETVTFKTMNNRAETVAKPMKTRQNNENKTKQ